MQVVEPSNYVRSGLIICPYQVYYAKSGSAEKKIEGNHQQEKVEYFREKNQYI